jgi:hypothetical protein
MKSRALWMTATFPHASSMIAWGSVNRRIVERLSDHSDGGLATGYAHAYPHSPGNRGQVFFEVQQSQQNT